jgi:hypothetical protein
VAYEETNVRDRETLFRMLLELIRILNAVILERQASLPRELEESILEAWIDFHTNHRERVFNALREVNMNALANVGLTGVQLQVKERGFLTASERWWRRKQSNPPGFFGRSRRWWRRRVLKELQNALGWANIWLRSLTSVIQVSEILVEMKEVVEKALDMTNEDENNAREV